MPLLTGRTLQVPAGVDRLLRDLIHERAGIYFDNERLEQLLDKLEPLALQRSCYSYLNYYYLLKKEENGKEDWARLADALAVPETYFWREMAQVRVLTEVIVREWFRRTSAPLRIWSAACSSGEEPFTIVMALLEGGWGSHPIEVVASDASGSAVARARAGMYRENSFRALPPDLKMKYFTGAGAEWRIKSAVATRVAFSQANLLNTEEISALACSPVIFCRNVFIYFSPHAIRQTVAAFAAHMPHAGHLFVGASESLLRLTTDFELREMQEAFGYVRI
jgi:chemotaxis protein methyltransferase CheR